MADTDTVDAQAQTDPKADDAQDTANATGQNGGTDERTFTQADVDRLIEDRLKRAADKAEKDRLKAGEAAESKRLEDQKEFEKLATQRAGRITELEAEAEKATTLTEQLERSNKALSTYVATLREGLPQSVLVLLDKSDIVEQLEWLAENREAIIGNDKEPDKPLTKGVPASPKANTNGIPDDEKRKRAANTWRT